MKPDGLHLLGFEGIRIPWDFQASLQAFGLRLMFEIIHPSKQRPKILNNIETDKPRIKILIELSGLGFGFQNLGFGILCFSDLPLQAWYIGVLSAVMPNKCLRV